jgi:hypothetical protein
MNTPGGDLFKFLADDGNSSIIRQGTVCRQTGSKVMRSAFECSRPAANASRGPNGAVGAPRLRYKCGYAEIPVTHLYRLMLQDQQCGSRQTSSAICFR